MIPEHDYVIVGAGAAGCVLASRLSQTSGNSVLLLDAGPLAKDPRISDPSRWAELADSEYDWAFSTEPQKHLDDRTIAWPRGRVVGGSTAMNAMLFLRGSASDYAGWSDGATGTDWSYAALQPHFERVESDGGGELGTGLGVVRHGEGHPWSEAFVASAVRLGYRRNGDFNVHGATGVGYYSVTRAGDKRRSAVDGFLHDPQTRPGLEILPEARVTRLVTDGAHVTGVEYINAGTRPTRVHARREVLLAAGTVGSPHLLMLSGMGPADVLRSYGLPVVADLPGVGRNLHDHIATGIQFRSAHPDPSPARHGLGDAGLFAPEVDTTGPTRLHAWLGPSTDPKGETFSLGVGVTSPRSRGTITLVSSDPSVSPRIQPVYLSDERDLLVLMTGYDLLWELADAAPLRQLRAGAPTAPAPHDLPAVERYIRSNASTQFHPVGTCRLGTDSLSVVDPELRVHGVSGLRVVDASVFPSITTGGTQAPVYALASRAADLVNGV